MADPSEGDSPRPASAEAAYREYRDLLAAGKTIDFNEFSKHYPEIEDALRAYHSMMQAGDSTTTDTVGSQTPWDVQPGTRIGPYDLKSILGEGGFGTVFLADQERPIRRKVALKLLKAGLDTREIVARFENERQALAMMSHAGIAKVHDAGATDWGRPYFVMEYVEGEPITSYCDRKRLRTRERLELFVRVCDAVQHAHQKAIIHRDLKPSNVLVAEENEKAVPKIIDFGIAKVIHQQQSAGTLVTAEGKMMGTPEYMSPEQAEMSEVDVDTRTDIYSLGALLYEILSGTLPFNSKALRAAGNAKIPKILRESQPPKPSTRLEHLKGASLELAGKRTTEPQLLVKELRGDLDCIVMKAMAKEPEMRYASASELAADIQRHLRFEPVLARPPSLHYRAGRFLRKHRMGAGLVTGLAAILVLYLAVSYAASEIRRRKGVEELRTAIDSRGLSEAQAQLAVLEDRYPATVARLGLREDVRSLALDEAIEQSQTIRARARETWAKNRKLTALEKRLRAQWASERDSRGTWEPVWERSVELETWRKLQLVREQVEDSYNQTVLGLHEALRVAPKGNDEEREVRRAIEDVYWERYQEAGEEGEVSFAVTFLEREIESYGTGDRIQQIRGGGVVQLSTTPAGAEAYCFRYENVDGRKVPFPFSPAAWKADPEKGVLERPPLEVDAVWKPQLTSFRTGDQILTIAGESVHTHEDLAACLKGVPPDKPVPVSALRLEDSERRKLTFEWIPFPSSEAREDGPWETGRLVEPFVQCGVTFRAYPLHFGKGNHVGGTRNDGPISVELPRGSFLFVLRKDGYEEARVPVLVPDDGVPQHVRLVRAEEIPPGFVYIPEGPVRTGGDSKAFQGLPWQTSTVGGFFMSRHEITVEEWLAFVNDPEVLQRTNLEGKLLPITETVSKALERVRLTRISLIPPSEVGGYWTRASENDPWSYGLSVKPRWPAFGISHFAAVEYAAWRTRTQPARGRRWDFRLPTDEEWERAARGVDRRTYVWGDYLVWSFCLSRRKLPEEWVIPSEIGSHPFDESVFGVRDLAGSVCEHTTGTPAAGLRNTAYRGGSWQNTDEEYFHVASRNSLVPEEMYAEHSGFRLVAELTPLKSNETGQ